MRLLNTDTLEEARAKLLAEAEKAPPGIEYVPFERKSRPYTGRGSCVGGEHT